MRQNAALCALLPGTIGPGAEAVHIRAARSTAVTIASSDTSRCSPLSHCQRHGAPRTIVRADPSRTLSPAARFRVGVDFATPAPLYSRLRTIKGALIRSQCREAHLPAQQPRSQAPPRISGTHGNGSRTQGAGVAARKGPQTSVRLSL